MLCLTASALGAAPAHALDVPALISPVMDRARVLGPQQLRALDERLRNFERNTGRVVVVHTTPSLEGLAINEYSSRVAERWRLRRAELASGAILTFAPNERKANVEVGPQLQEVLADPEIYQQVQKQILEEFRRQDVARGIEVGVDAMLVAIARTGRPADLAATPPSGAGVPAPLPDGWLLGLLLSSLVAISWIVLGAAPRDRLRRRRRSERSARGSAWSEPARTRPSAGRERRRAAAGDGWQPVDSADTSGWSYFDASGADDGDGGGDGDGGARSD